MKTQNELRKEWGDERFLYAMRDLSAFYVGRKSAISPSVEELHALAEKNPDALNLLSARLAETILITTPEQGQ
jgi:hypothetical protein